MRGGRLWQRGERVALHLLVGLLPLMLASQQVEPLEAVPPADTLAAGRLDTARVGPLFHNPPVAILNDRPFKFDFFVNFDPGEILSVSLLLRKDSSVTYQEFFLEGEFARYEYILPVHELRGAALTYYFLVNRKDYGLWAYPTGPEGAIEPFVIDLVPPTKEFFQKRYYD